MVGAELVSYLSLETNADVEDHEVKTSCLCLHWNILFQYQSLAGRDLHFLMHT